ncbi:MAG: type II toxin-antitoxin system prevent-host-death family antitoxin [Deltaproteobacteria bacterium]
MKTASVTELKANLSRYLDMVRRGNEVQVLERGVPIARLVGLERTAVRGAKEEEEKLQRLERAGIIVRGTGDLRWLLERDPPKIPGADLSEALRADREDRF